MQGGALHKLIAIFNQSFDALGVQVDPQAVEKFAVIVHKAMTIQTRNYHNLEHVFEFVEPSDPIRTLAALYHDLVYYQVDRGFLPEIRKIISPHIQENDGSIILSDGTGLNDRLFQISLDLFNFNPGQELSLYDGLNEFLSAVVMNKQLGDLIPEADWLKITLCIEATIPFRDQNQFYRLEERALNVIKKYGVGLTREDIVESIIRAVNFANKDVGSFAEQDVGKFIEATWKLLPETHVELRSRDVYSIREYRRALDNTEAFFSSLNPNHIYHSYWGTPDEIEFEEIGQRARRNILVGSQYLRIKLLTQAILEALALVSGGDAPLALFMGDLPKEGERTQRLEDLLPEWENKPWVNSKEPVYRLLEKGQMEKSGFDLNTAPLALFIYKNLNPEKQTRFLSLAKDMFLGKLHPEDFLTQIDHEVVAAVARASAAMVVSRREELLKFDQPGITSHLV